MNIQVYDFSNIDWFCMVMSHSFPSLPGDEYANARTPQSLRNPGHIEPQNCRSFTRSLVDRSQGSWPKEWTAAAAIVAHHLQEKVKVYDKPRSGVMMGTIKLEVDSSRSCKVQALAKHDNTTITTIIKWLNPHTTQHQHITQAQMQPVIAPLVDFFTLARAPTSSFVSGVQRTAVQPAQIWTHSQIFPNSQRTVQYIS